jgi:hypothetical protein
MPADDIPQIEKLSLPTLEAMLHRIAGALPPETVAAIVAPYLAPMIRQSVLATAVVKAVAKELG